MGRNRVYSPPQHVMSTNGNGAHYGPPPPIQAGSFTRTEVWLRPQYEDESVAEQYPVGWMFLYWRNHPMHLRRTFAAVGDKPSNEEWIAAFKELVPAHNGWTWTNREGHTVPFPPTSDDAFWDQVPHDVLYAVHRAIIADINRPLPNLPQTKKATLRSTSSSAKRAAALLETPSPGPTSERS